MFHMFVEAKGDVLSVEANQWFQRFDQENILIKKYVISEIYQLKSYIILPLKTSYSYIITFIHVSNRLIVGK